MNISCSTVDFGEFRRQRRDNFYIVLLAKCTRLTFVLAAVLTNSVQAQVYNRPTYSSPIAISQNDQLVWVVNPDANSVSVIRPDNNSLLATIGVGAEPQSIALTPNGQYAYVANAAAGTISIIQITDPAWGTFSASVVATLTTGAEPWNIVTSPDGLRVFVANSAQDTITVINATTRTIIGHVDLRNSIANDPDRSRHFQPRGMAVTLDNTKLYVTRFLSFTKAGGRQGDDFGKEGLVAVLDINTASTTISGYTVARVVSLAPQITGFKYPGLTNDTAAFPNQLQSIVIRGSQAYLPNIAASPTGPLRFNLDTHAFVSVIDGVTGTTPVDAGTNKFLNLHFGARDPEPGKIRYFFANPWAIAFTTQSGVGNAYVVSAASDLLVKLNVDAAGKLSFTVDGDTTRYIDLNDPNLPATSAAHAGKNPQGIAITSDGTRAYVANFVSRNVSVVNLTSDAVIATVSCFGLPAPVSSAETNLVGAEMFFSSRGNFDTIPGTNSLRNRLSSEGWQSCASCHFKGLTDGVTWQFAAGPRKSLPLNATFSPHNRVQQRVLNYSAIFDEVEDFEAIIRNVSGPGVLGVPVNGNNLDPNHGLLIADTGDLNVAPSAINAFARVNADRPQVTVTLPGSANKVPALTALREWVRNAVRTPNGPMAGFPNAPAPADITAGRTLFAMAGCANCHGGKNWTTSIKDFTSPPSGPEYTNTERSAVFTGNPVAVQYLNRFLRDVGSFNLGVPGQGNNLGNNIGADEKTAPAVISGVLQAAQDALGRDYNSDGKGIGYNVPSLLGIYSVPPYLHNGAAESLAQVVADPKHRTANGTLPDVLTNATDRANLVGFLESLDVNTVPASATLMVLPLGGGTVNINPGTNFFPLNSTATLTAVPDAPNIAFFGWSGDATGSQNPLPVVLDTDKLIYANFTTCYTLATSVVGAGTISRNPDQSCYAPNTVVTLTAVPTPGNLFNQWSGPVTELDKPKNPLSVVMDGDKSYTANFAVPGLACAAAASGLVHWWPAGDDANDIIGSANGSMINGASFGTGKVGTAFSLDGVDDRILVSGFGQSVPTTEITIEFWQKANAAAAQSTFSQNTFIAGSVFNAQIPYSDGNIYWDFGNNTSGRLSYTPPVSIVGSWQHFALVASQSGNFMRIYRNGVLEAEKNGMIPFGGGNIDLAIGGAVGSSFGGMIDELSIYDRALSSLEIRAIYIADSAGKCKSCTPVPEPISLVAWWPAGGNANDVAGTNNGVLVNGATFAPGRVGQAFSFDGVDDRIDTPLRLHYPGVTMAAWIKTTDLNSMIIRDGGGYPAENGMGLFVSGGHLQLFVNFTYSYLEQIVLTGPVVSDGQWHHVAGYCGGNAIFLYADGNLVDSGGLLIVDVPASPPVSLGAHALLPFDPYTGLMDEVCIWEGPRPDIFSIYKAGGGGLCLTPIDITSVTRTGDNLTLTWTTQRGLSYRVQYKTDLNPTTPWTDVGGDVTANSTTANKTIVVPAEAPQRFYRVEVFR